MIKIKGHFKIKGIKYNLYGYVCQTIKIEDNFCSWAIILNKRIKDHCVVISIKLSKWLIIFVIGQLFQRV